MYSSMSVIVSCFMYTLRSVYIHVRLLVYYYVIPIKILVVGIHVMFTLELSLGDFLPSCILIKRHDDNVRPPISTYILYV
jgi:hypothetical protein